MEAAWRLYLEEHAPELYAQMLADLQHGAKWRDDLIEKLKKENDELGRSMHEGAAITNKLYEQMKDWEDRFCNSVKEFEDGSFRLVWTERELAQAKERGKELCDSLEWK